MLAYLYYYDPLYFMLVIPPALLAIWAQFRVKSAYAAGSQQPNSRGISGAQAAREVLDANGLHDVNIEMSQGFLSDHYDPRGHVLRLSPDVYEGRSMASVGIAAHEAGHAIQHAKGYAPLKLRSGLVPLAQVGSWLSVILLGFGTFLFVGASSSRGGFAQTCMLIGTIGFGMTVLFQIVNLPVEFDASRRARYVLADTGIVAPQEMSAVSRVLNAAALTYVAATLAALMQLIYFLIRSGLLGGRDSR